MLILTFKIIRLSWLHYMVNVFVFVFTQDITPKDKQYKTSENISNHANIFLWDLFLLNRKNWHIDHLWPWFHYLKYRIYTYRETYIFHFIWIKGQFGSHLIFHSFSKICHFCIPFITSSHNTFIEKIFLVLIMCNYWPCNEDFSNE